jgi:hypothetical protein
MERSQPKQGVLFQFKNPDPAFEAEGMDGIVTRNHVVTSK